MAKPAKKENASIKKSTQRWQSDVIVDLIKQYGFPYIALNPGASFRGLHDSLVNYGENDPPMLLCNHEKIAVQIAHGYTKASGKPMMAIVHDVVGCCTPQWESTTPTSTVARFLSWVQPAPWTKNTAARSSTGFTPPSPKAM